MTKSEFLYKIAMIIILDLRPFNIVNNEGFSSMIESFNLGKVDKR